MNRRKLVEWAGPDQFLLCANDLRLYRLAPATHHQHQPQPQPGQPQPPQPGRRPVVRFAPEAPAAPGQPALVAVAPELQFPKCLAWCEPGALAAAGLLNGKVVLTSFAAPAAPPAGSSGSAGSIGVAGAGGGGGGGGAGGARNVKEFVPRHSRSCNAVAWNPVHRQQLAAGLDKVRNDYSVLVWDVEARGEAPPAAPPSTASAAGAGSPGSASSAAAETVTRASTELANSEATVALAWLPHMPSCLAAGTGVKWLRIYDLRGDLNAPPSVVAHSKGVYGVQLDPFAEHRLATFSDSPDGVVKLWDLRMLTDPVFALNTASKALQQVCWSPTRPGVLATLSKDELGVKLWDLKESDRTGALGLNAPPRTQPSTEGLSSVAWHPRLEHALLTASHSGVVELVSVHVPVALSWSPHAALALSYAKRLSVLAQPGSRPGDQGQGQEQEEVDVSEAMRRRLEAGYSIELAANRALGKQGALPRELKRLWGWMHRVAHLFADSQPLPASAAPAQAAAPQPAQLHQADRFRGVYGLLAASSSSSSSPSSSLDTAPAAPGQLTVGAWRSPARSLALQLCGGGWELLDGRGFEARLGQLAAKGQHERAAALAVFHRRLRQAIDVLRQGAESRGQALASVGLVLAGYNEGEQGALWREQVRLAARQYEHPYLRAGFAFLTADARDFRAVLEPPPDGPAAGPPPPGGLSLRDRVAFAATFLADGELAAFLERQTTAAVRAGSLEGVVLTGLGPRGLELLESYVDRTGDVQTACLLVQHAPARRASPPDERVVRWNEAYRAVLNRWGAWAARARLDIAHYRDAPEAEAKPPAQVFARCNFCNQSLALGMIVPSKLLAAMASKARAAKGAAFSGKQRVSSCPSCNKPLPRCALCLMHLGCSIPSLGGGVAESVAGAAPFGEWFTWCQTCRHGGHTRHLADWFRTHDRCPVTDCNCACNSL